MSNRKEYPHDTDEILKMYLTKHLCLISVNRELHKLAGEKHYREAELPASEIEEDLEKELKKRNITPDHIGPNMASLVEEQYISLLSRDAGKTMFIKILPKGFVAMTSGEFYMKYESRQRDLFQIESSKIANRTNFWIMIFAGATVLLGLATLLRECKRMPESINRNTERQYQDQSPKLKSIDTLPQKKDSVIQ